MTTFGYLYRRSLEAALEAIAAAGFRFVEIASTPPHLFAADFDAKRRAELRRKLASLGLKCSSINPPDLNLISPNPALRDIALSHYELAIRLAADVGAEVVVVIAGRQSPLIPMPGPDAEELALRQLGRLAAVADTCGVDLAVETVPFGFTETAGQAVAVVDKLGHERVGVAVDVANVFGKQEVGAAVVEAAPHLKIAHFSDTWKDRWAHTVIGHGEIEFPAFFDALRAAGYAGPCIYELVDGGDPDQTLRDDLARLAGWGVVV